MGDSAKILTMQDHDRAAWAMNGALAQLVNDTSNEPALAEYCVEARKAMRIMVNAYPIVEAALRASV